MTIILFLVVLAFLIFIHELGHFSVAKWFKVTVEEFGIGFPPRLFSWRRGQTAYSLNLIPFGGFVKLQGEDDWLAAGGPVPGSLTAQSRPVQILIMAAGVLANVVLAWFLLSLALWLGLPAAASTTPRDWPLQDPALVIINVKDRSPAAAAGLKPGDRVITLVAAGETLNQPMAETATALIRQSSGPITLIYQSIDAPETKTAVIEPAIGLVEVGRPAIGVTWEVLGTVKLPPATALKEGVFFTGRMIAAVGSGLKEIIRQSLAGEKNLLTSFIGPVGLAGLVGDASDFGPAYLLAFVAFISVNLAIFNLLPLPALDGGRILVLVGEGLCRRRLPTKLAAGLNLAGFVLILGLMLLITAMDIGRLL